MESEELQAESVRRLDLELLFTDLPTMTEWLAGECYSAIVVCLEHNGHSSGVDASVWNFDERLSLAKVLWATPIDDLDRRNWGGPGNAAERAGEGIAWLIINEFTEYTVIERSIKGGGFDFWLGHKQDAANLVFVNKAHLEVKGRTKLEYESQVRQLAKDALDQITASDRTGLPALAVVTDFSRPLIYLVQK